MTFSLTHSLGDLRDLDSGKGYQSSGWAYRGRWMHSLETFDQGPCWPCCLAHTLSCKALLTQCL